MKRKILVFALLLSLFITLIPTTTSIFGATSASPDTEWTLVTDAREMKGYPDLREYVWQKTPNMLPNEQYDKIGLHRLIKQGITPKGVFVSVSGSTSNGETTISNPPTDSFVKTENSYPPIYWANKGFDVYYMDQRSHFVPTSLNASQLSFMANWGWDQWISDMREVVLKVKEISGAQKVFMATGGNEAPLNYATLYPNDLAGIIMLEPSLYGIGGSPVAVKRGNEMNTFNLTKEIATMKSFGNWSTPVSGWSLWKSAADNPEAPVTNETVKPLGLPLINPLTNKTWANITELCTYVLYFAYGSKASGALSNLYGGYGSATADIQFLSQCDRYGLPARLKLESLAMADWVNCPYVTNDFDDNWNKITVPLISFNSQLSSNMTGTFRFVNGIGTSDFTGVMLPKYGALDVVLGTYAAKDVYQPALEWMINHSTAGWTLVTNARAMKAYPDLKEYVWQKNASMAPNGQYDKIGLHRLVKTGITPIGVIFMTDCPNWGAGEQHISNPPTDNWTKYENYSSAIYWANRGFDVYAIDYRTHFVPKDLNASQMSFAANWGWDVWISDIKEAANKVKEVSGSKKFFMEGQCSGGEAALNYATKYWKDDISGIVLLDAFYPGASGYPIVGRIAETNTYNMTKAISNMNTAGNWSSESLRPLRPVASYAIQNPDAPAAYPPGTPLNPPLNPITNKTWANITEWFTWRVQNNFGSTTTPPGIFSNLVGGYGNISQDEYCLANTEFLPVRLFIENAAMADWVNCPDLSYDFNDHYNEIGVPVLAFEGPYVNQTGKFKFVQGTNNTDFTGNWMPKYGHLDIFFGTYSARDISQPALEWMINHTFPAITFSNGFEDGFASWTATQGGASIATSPVHSGNYAMKCSNPWGSQATKTMTAQSKTYAEAQFYFSQDFAGSQSLIAFFDADGNPTVEMGLSVQSGKLFAFVQTNLPSYSYSQYPLLGLLAETWYKFALDTSATSATIYIDDQQLTDTSLPNIAATASVCVGMFWGDGSYKGNLYIDSVQISDCAPKPVIASVFASGFEDGFTSWNKTYGGALVVSSPVYSGNYSMKCSGPMGSLATKSIGKQTGTLAEAEFYFDGNIAGSQTLIAYFDRNGDPSVSMGLSVQEGRVFAYVQSILPSYSYSQYELTGFTSGTWVKFALGVSATSAAIYMYNQKLTSISQTNIPVTASVGVGMFWADGSYKGNLYIDSVQIGSLPPLELPEGAYSIEYYTFGNAVINLPTPLPANYPPTATQIKIEPKHVEIPNDKIDFCQLLIQLYVGSPQSWQPFAIITTSSDDAAFMKNFWPGTYIEFPGPYYNPANVETDNVKLVSEDALQVERHGNKMFVNLKVPQQIQRPNGVNFTVPAFSMELNGYGGPFYTSETFEMTGYYGTSNYTWKVDYQWLKITGGFTSSAWNYSSYPISENYLTIHGTGVYYPPT